MQTIPVFCGKDCGGKTLPAAATLETGRVTRVANNVAAGKYHQGCRRGFDLPLEPVRPRSGPQAVDSDRCAAPANFARQAGTRHWT